jgi:hypothetical protein
MTVLFQLTLVLGRPITRVLELEQSASIPDRLDLPEGPSTSLATIKLFAQGVLSVLFVKILLVYRLRRIIHGSDSKLDSPPDDSLVTRAI